jgi:hypothetical protein
MKNEITFTRVKNDTNGNPRYVTHFLNFITDQDREQTKESEIYQVGQLYELALKKARKIGGRKFHNKQYGGGVVFQSYNIEQTKKRILEILIEGK